ncbi:ATP-binding domain-containing protein [Flavobacterium sp.]|uniref:ATP-binding domain-containing protein n=1 Tax=Flavobacterium sp. TaxID=239 RepID=UPI002CFC75E3|nr:ATP-binding domain-containing protein [Flavobacterium sp.]HSD06248.1 ATP-binding domain-containing protein [Flavobacterium sp.]
MYDAVLIDEYQDFYDDWIKLCIKICKKHNHENELKENIFLAGDRLQSIYNPREHSWEQLGIKIRGRSKLLKHTYRSGKSHIDLALKVLLTDKTLKREVERFYEGKNGIDNETNLMSEIQFIEGGPNTIADLLHNLINIVGYNYGDIMILFPTLQNAQQFYSILSPQIQSNAKVTKEIIENTLIITTYHSSKGLESRICIMANADGITDLKLLYVAMTRASQRLYIHAFNFANSTIAQKIREGNLIEADSIEANINGNLLDLRRNNPIDEIDDLPF